jgi:hypothetical protein
MPIQFLTDALRSLPPGARKTIYTALALFGVALAVCGYAGIDDLGPFSLDQAMAIYATLSPVIGGVAVANVGSPDKSPQFALSDFDEDVDLSSFEPVGDPAEVFEGASA